MKAAGRPVVRAIKSRTYAAQAAAQRVEQQGSLPKQQAKVSRLANGAVVASLENYSPISRVAVLYNAGPRFEAGPNLGISHTLRNASNLSTEKSTGFGITKNIQQIGANLSCTTTRENLIYSVECLRNQLDTGVQYLAHASTVPVFKPWEVKELTGRLQFDLSLLEQQPHALLMEALHKAAFRNTIGNSLYITEGRIGTHTPELLQEYVRNHFRGGNMALVGVGVDHDQLTTYAKQFGVTQGAGPAAEKAAYGGGEIRIDNNSPIVHAAVVCEGVSLTSPDLLAVGVLQRLMGSGPSIKYGSNSASSRVTIAAAKTATAPFAASCINASYSDAGIFGFHVVGNAGDMGKILPSVVSAFTEMTKGSFSEAEVEQAKYRLKAAIRMGAENSDNLLEDIGTQALYGSGIVSLDELDSAIDKIKAADVQAITKKVMNKASMAAVGDLSSTPYLDQLL